MTAINKKIAEKHAGEDYTPKQKPPSAQPWRDGRSKKDKMKPGKIIKTGERQYWNPIYLVKEWRQALDNGEYASRTILARHLKVSKTRATQTINLLKLPPEVIEIIYSLGDPISGPIITEKRLRPLVGMSADKQIEQVKIVLSM